MAAVERQWRRTFGEQAKAGLQGVERRPRDGVHCGCGSLPGEIKKPHLGRRALPGPCRCAYATLTSQRRACPDPPHPYGLRASALSQRWRDLDPRSRTRSGLLARQAATKKTCANRHKPRCSATTSSFSSIRNGPALRVVVDADDDPTMIQYAYLVASRRGHV